MGYGHELGRNGQCIDCIKAQDAPEHSICWACGHDVDHQWGHECPAYADEAGS